MRFLLIILLCLLTSPAWALTLATQAAVDTSYTAPAGGGTAPTYVNSNSGYDSGPITLSGVTAGNTLVACVSGGGALTSTSLSGWTALATAGTATNFSRCYYLLSASAGNLSIAITSPPSDPGWTVAEYSGVGGFDTSTAGDTGMTSPYTTPSITVAQDHSAVIVFVADETANTGAVTWTGSGTVGRQSNTSHAHYLADHVDTSAGSLSTTFTGTNNATPQLVYLISLQGS
jgi:hypothetical protein